MYVSRWHSLRHVTLVYMNKMEMFAFPSYLSIYMNILFIYPSNMCILMYYIYDVLVKRQAVVKVDSFHMFAKLYDITKCQQNRILWCCQTVFITMVIFFTTARWFTNERIQLLTVSLLQSGKDWFVYKNALLYPSQV